MQNLQKNRKNRSDGVSFVENDGTGMPSIDTDSRIRYHIIVAGSNEEEIFRKDMFPCDTREWLSGGAPPCQGGGRGFDPRLALEGGFRIVRCGGSELSLCPDNSRILKLHTSQYLVAIY